LKGSEILIAPDRLRCGGPVIVASVRESQIGWAGLGRVGEYGEITKIPSHVDDSDNNNAGENSR
jgi:hypothetical protein